MEFDQNPGEEKDQIMVSPPRFRGKAGEVYFDFNPNELSPSILVKDKRGRKIWSGKFCTT